MRRMADGGWRIEEEGEWRIEGSGELGVANGEKTDCLAVGSISLSPCEMCIVVAEG